MLPSGSGTALWVAILLDAQLPAFISFDKSLIKISNPKSHRNTDMPLSPLSPC